MKRLTEAQAGEAFARAARHFEAGQLDEAASLCRELQGSFSKHPGVLALFGFVQLARGHRDEGLDKLARAAKLAPGEAGMQADIAAAFEQEGRIGPALEAWRHAAAAAPASAKIAAGFQRALAAAGRGDEARAARERFADQAALDEELGWTLLTAGRDEEALAAFERWAGRAPDSAAAHDAVGQALQKLRRWDAAIVAHARALEIAPREGAMLLNLGAALVLGGKVTEAEAVLRRAMEVPAVAVDAEANLGTLRFRQFADEDGALAHLDSVLAKAPAHRAASLAAAWIRLARGEFHRGFALFEARFGPDALGRGMRAQPFRQPRWHGEDLSGRTLLLWGEQGIGDDIFFAHALPTLAERAARVLVWVDRRLVPVFRRSFPANVETFGREGAPPPALLAPAIDFQAPLGDAMRYAYAAPDAVPARRGFLTADLERAAALRRRYAALGPGKLVGISWRSVNPDHGERKSAGLEHWDPILRRPGAVFVNLQYGDVAAELEAARARTGARIVADPEIDQLVDMDAFAAQVAALDAVVTVGNAIAHTAGALGVPMEVLLGAPALWMWLRGRADSPFYPSARLHRQDAPGDWAGPIAAAAALDAIAPR